MVITSAFNAGGHRFNSGEVQHYLVVDRCSLKMFNYYVIAIGRIIIMHILYYVTNNNFGK